MHAMNGSSFSRTVDAAKVGGCAALANVIMAMPSEAAGKIFDFNLTLPIIATEFLLLMLVLDNVWFKPVGKVLDERDAKIRSKLTEMKDNSAEIQRLQDEAESIIGEARKEAQDAIAQAKAEAESQCAAKLAEAKGKVDQELEQAVAALQAQKEASMAGVDEQVKKLSDEIVSKLLPV